MDLRLFSFLRSREFLVYWLPPLLMTAGILAFSGDLGSFHHTRSIIVDLLHRYLSPYWITQVNYILRVAGHILAYGCLYLLWRRAVGGHLGFTGWRCLFWSLGLCLLVALMDEGHQSLVPTRSGSFRDVALDLASSSLVALGLFLFRHFQIIRRKFAL